MKGSNRAQAIWIADPPGHLRPQSEQDLGREDLAPPRGPRRANHKGLGNVNCGSASAHWRNSRRKCEVLVVLKRMLEIDPEAAFDSDEPDLQPLAATPKFKPLKELYESQQFIEFIAAQAALPLARE
jgi:hypothetical protein